MEIHHLCLVEEEQLLKAMGQQTWVHEIVWLKPSRIIVFEHCFQWRSEGTLRPGGRKYYYFSTIKTLKDFGT